MTTQYIILDNMDPIESPYMIDLDDAVSFIKCFYKTDAITVYAVDIKAGTSSIVSREVAYHWYRNALDFTAFDDCNDFPDFIRDNVDAAELQSDWAAFNTTTSELVG